MDFFFFLQSNVAAQHSLVSSVQQAGYTPRVHIYLISFHNVAIFFIGTQKKTTNACCFGFVSFFSPNTLW